MISDPALVAAIVGASVALVVGIIAAAASSYWSSRRAELEERARVRTVYAEAFAAVAAYKELPYAIHRRRPSELEAERIRLSEDMREIQEKLSYYHAWIRGESATVSSKYDELVAELRKVAGRACRDAWLGPLRVRDADMNFSPPIDLSAITPFENAFIEAVGAELKIRRRVKND